MTTAELQADSGVYQAGEGYQRTLLFTNWSTNNTRRLAKVDLRIDRIPGDSYAIVSVWNTDRGWVEVLRPHTVTYWHSMPGYTRHEGTRTEEETYRLAASLIEQIEELAVAADL